MRSEVWNLVPRVGIESGDARIHFGMDRQALRELLRSSFREPEFNGYADEDDFLTSDGSTWVRVRYSGAHVRTIEFLTGQLRFEDVELHAGTTFAAIEASFRARNLTFVPTRWLGEGMDCEALCISIATREDVGGDGDGIEWVILSTDFTSAGA